MKILLIDESKSGKFILCAVEIDATKAAQTKSIIGQARHKGQSTIHFVKEKESRKRSILSIYEAVDMKVTCYIVRGQSETRARAACLRALVEDLDRSTAYSIVFDQDENYVEKDKALLSDRLSQIKTVHLVSYKHMDPSTENLLWLPDAIAWVVSKGSSWKRHLRNFDVRIRNVP